MKGICNPENGFFSAVSIAVDVVGLSLAWLLCSLPIITLGPATVALYYAAVKCLRRGEGGTYANYFRSFWDNLKLGTVAGLLMTALFGLLWMGLGTSFQMAVSGDSLAVVSVAAGGVLALVLLGVSCYVFPALSRFQLGFREVVALSLGLAMGHLPSTLAMAVVVLAAVWVCNIAYGAVFVLPCLTALLCSLLMERILKPLTPKPEGVAAEELPWYLR